jgi:ATP-dependent RNA helicase DDX24/MAK5
MTLNREDQTQTSFDSLSGTEMDNERGEAVHDGLQTFVFSATLSKDLQRNVKKRSRPKSFSKHDKRKGNSASTLGMAGLLSKIRSG